MLPRISGVMQSFDHMLLDKSNALSPQFPISYKLPSSIFLTNRISSNLEIKIFGCSAFVHLHYQNHGRLDLRSNKCISWVTLKLKKGIGVIILTKEILYI